MDKRLSLFFAIVFSISLCASAAELKIGDAPALQASSTNGQMIDLQDFAGKMVLVDFWATWSKPSMDEVPHLLQISKDYSAKGLVIIGISLDHIISDIDPVTQARGMTWQEIWSPGGTDDSLSKQWGADPMNIPRAVLVSPDGHVLWTGNPTDLDPALKKAFQEHPPKGVSAELHKQTEEILTQMDAALDANQPDATVKLLWTIEPEALSDPELKAHFDKARLKLLELLKPELAKYEPDMRGIMEIAETTPRGKDAPKDPDSPDDPKVRERDADAALAQAEKFKVAKQEKLAYQRFVEITRFYKGTEAATKAKAAVAEFERNPAFMKAKSAEDQDRKASAALTIADGYKNAGLTDKAKKKYQEVIDEFPSTPQAKTAADSLQAMGN